MKLSERIKELREGLKLTQSGMAVKLGLTKNHYWRIEKGSIDPSISLLNKIAEVTGTNLTVLLEDKPSDIYIVTRSSPTNTSFLAQAEAEALKSLDKSAEDAIMSGEPTTKLDIASMVEKQKGKTKKK